MRLRPMPRLVSSPHGPHDRPSTRRSPARRNHGRGRGSAAQWPENGSSRRADGCRTNGDSRRADGSRADDRCAAMEPADAHLPRSHATDRSFPSEQRAVRRRPSREQRRSLDHPPGVIPRRFRRVEAEPYRRRITSAGVLECGHPERQSNGERKEAPEPRDECSSSHIISHRLSPRGTALVRPCLAP